LLEDNGGYDIQVVDLDEDGQLDGFTLGGGADGIHPIEGHNLIKIVNNAYNLFAFQNPNTWDLEHHQITVPSGTSEVEFLDDIINAYVSYNDSTSENPIHYDVDPTLDLVEDADIDDDGNCATWVNSLLAVIGISEDDRIELGEFSGIDWGAEIELPAENFELV
ncbi:hypothetical protein TI03_05955, partial [Achromatium sp. WMS1]